MKKIILNEAQERVVISMMIKPGGLNDKQYPIHPEKVLLVKKFLDNGYKRGQAEEIGPDGFPCLVPCFGMLDSSKCNVLRNIMKDEMYELLQSRFPNIYPEEEHKKKFLGQVMQDWYNNKIGLYGSLSVNHL